MNDHSLTLRSENLVKIYKKRKVVNDVSIQVKQGEIVGLLGPNGAGKTTTFYMIIGFIKPEGGKILLDHDDITLLPMYERARRGIGYLSQEPSIFRKLSVEQNIMAILEMQKIPKRERDKVVVGDICRKKLISTNPEESVLDALKKMEQNNIGRILVVDRNDPKKLLGILTKHDVMHVLTFWRSI